MKEIQLTQGKVALVDDEDWEIVSRYRWRAVFDHEVWYAKTDYMDGDKKRIINMGSFILGSGIPSGLVDHINLDGLDNRRGNLRYCTYSENNVNRRKRSGTSSKFVGIYWHERTQRWRARIGVGGNKIWLGSFRSEVEAAQAYNEGAVKFYGEFARLNEIR